MRLLGVEADAKHTRHLDLHRTRPQALCGTDTNQGLELPAHQLTLKAEL